MSKICATCGNTQGPFNTSWSNWNIPICKKTKANQDRISECVARRDKIDIDKYKEQMSAYAD